MDILVTIEVGDFPIDDQGVREKRVKGKREILISLTNSSQTKLTDCAGEIRYHILKALERFESTLGRTGG